MCPRHHLRSSQDLCTQEVLSGAPLPSPDVPADDNLRSENVLQTQVRSFWPSLQDDLCARNHLRSADLRSADLRSADLRSEVLRSQDVLRSEDLLRSGYCGSC